GVDEWVKSGFTKLLSSKIAPPGVAESPMVMECRLLHHIDLGGGPASGNLMIGEVVMFHIRESAFDGKYLDAERLDLVGRMGGPLYCRASGSAVFTLAKPSHVGIGFDALPEHVRNSPILTGSDLAKLAGARELPDPAAVATFWREKLASAVENVPDDIEVELRLGDPERALDALLPRLRGGAPDAETEALLHRVAKVFLHRDMIERAWQCVLAVQA
ncbi:MAG: hypothetical protein ABI876_14305, partial [Bacteroidota bacterium]